MPTLRISDAPLLPDVEGTEKIPTGGRGDYAISVDQIKGHIFQNIGKELVGLGNVDNTSDLDKPVSTAQQAALNLKADKTYVDTNLDLKADKTNVYTRSETTLALSTKADLVGGVIPSNQLPSYVDDVVEYTTNTLPIVGESGKIYVTTDTNRTWRWSGNQYVEISNGGISDSTLKLQTPRKIANVDFDGTQNIDLPHNNLKDRDVVEAHPASAISYGTIDQEKYNNGLESIAAMLAIANPINGMRVYVKSYHAGLRKGGGWFVYDSTKASTNDTGMVINGWVRQLDSNEIDPVCFGAKAEFYGTNQATAFDDAPAVQKTVKYLSSIGGGRVIFGNGKYWLNSYQTEAGSDGWNIINLRSDVSFEWKNNSQVVVGNYFHDKGFHVFSGIIANNPRLKNVHFIRPHITSLLEENYMETIVTRRVAIEMWHHENCTIFDGLITNMDLSNCIGVGVTFVNNPSKFSLIKRMKFINVVYPTTKSINNDHTSIYLNSQNSSVDDCDFINEGDKGWMIACPVELHESNTVFSNSRVNGYTRGGWFVGDKAGETSNQRITSVTATVTNKGFNITCSPNGTLKRCIADNNVYYLKHPTNVRNDAYYGNQVLFHIDDDNSPANAISDFVIKDNTVNYLNSTMLFFRKMFDIPHDVKNFIVDNNTFNVITGGVKVGDAVTNLDGWKITRNKFYADVSEGTQEVFLDFSTTDKLTNFTFEDNEFDFFNDTPNYLVKVNFPNRSEQVRLGKIHGTEQIHPKIADYLFPNRFASDTLNYINGKWYNLTLTIPQLAVNEVKRASTNFNPNIALPFRSTAKYIAPIGYEVYLLDSMRAYQGGVAPAVGNLSGGVYSGASLSGTIAEITGLT